MNRKHKIALGGGTMLAALLTVGFSAGSGSPTTGDGCALQLVQATPRNRTLPDATTTDQNTLPGSAAQGIESAAPAAPGTAGTSGMTPGTAGPSGMIVAPDRTDTVTGGNTGVVDGAGASTTDNAGTTATDRTPGGTVVPGSGPATIPPTGGSGASGAGTFGGGATGGTGAGVRTR